MNLRARLRMAERDVDDPQRLGVVNCEHERQGYPSDLTGRLGTLRGMAIVYDHRTPVFRWECVVSDPIVDEPPYPQVGDEDEESFRRDPRVLLVAQRIRRGPRVSARPRSGWPERIWWLILGAVLAFAVTDRVGWLHPSGALRLVVVLGAGGYGGWFLIRTELQLRRVRRLHDAMLTAPTEITHAGGWWRLSWYDEAQPAFDPEPGGVNLVAYRRWRVLLHVGERRITVWLGRRRWQQRG